MIAIQYHPLYALAGLLVGALVGLTGVGGGSLMTPLLVLAFGFHPSTAVGTDLLYAAATKGVGTLAHDRRGTVEWRVVGWLAAGSIPAALATLMLLGEAGVGGPATQRLISVTLGVMLMLTSAAVLCRPAILRVVGPAFDRMSPRRTRAATLALGVALGALVSISSVGAGAIGMTALMALYPRLPVNRLVGSDIAHAVPLTLVAGLGHLFIGSVDLSLLVSLLSGSVPGILVGSLLATRASEGVLRPVLAVTLAAVGLKLAL